MTTKTTDYDDLKKRGFLKQRQDGFFVLRTRTPAGVYSNEQLDKLSEIAQRYGKGFAHATTRQGLEIPFIKADDIAAVEKALRDAGIETGASGACLRTTTCCPGNNWCRQGLIDTFALNQRIEKELGITCGADLPHKFKIAISGCPNMCTRPDASEIGIHGQADSSSPDKRIGYVIYVGGCGGRLARPGIKLGKIFTENEVLALIEKIVTFYKANAKPRQRLAAMIDQTGKDAFLRAITGVGD
jgi:dissimilatory sulfite reductase (desulfoviridin) alpha/beta subunit